MLNIALRSGFSICALTLMLGGCQTDQSFTGVPSSNKDQYQVTTSNAYNANSPSLVVTNDPPPNVLYRSGSRDTVLANDDTAAASRTRLASFNGQNVETLVTRKVADLNKDLASLRRAKENFQDRLHGLQAKSDAQASEYYSLVAGINTELQSGTTPGNPVLVERWNVAQEKLNALSSSAGYLNELATDLANESSKAAYLQEAVRSTYGLSGAVKEDHVKLRATEDGVNQSIVELSRLLTSVNDEITRRGGYLRSERLNMQTTSLAIANGEMYGQSLTNSLFKRAAEDGQELFKGDASNGGATVPSQRRPLVVIRFDRANVNYEQAVYSAVGQALEKYPSAKFDLIAVSPAQGNPAEMALASTEARKNGESVLRSLTQMGLPMERIRLNAAQAKDVRNSEVHIYIQ